MQIETERDGEMNSTGRIHQCSGKEITELRSILCRDLYVVAVLTSSAALGSITPAAREDRKGGALISVR